MQFFSTLVLVGLAGASLMADQSPAFLVGRRLGERQYKSCQESFTAEWRTCAFAPWCYNPNVHVCCSNGGHCDKDEYCALPKTCCKKGQSLEECGATATVSTLPAPVATKGPGTSTGPLQAPTAPVSTPLPPVVTAGAEKNAQVGVLAAIGGLAAWLLAV